MKTLYYSLTEVCQHCGVEPQVITQFISHSWITPVSEEQQTFDHEDVARIQLICDLQNDFGVNDEAVPLILHLIDQLNHLHYKMQLTDSEDGQ